MSTTTDPHRPMSQPVAEQLVYAYKRMADLNYRPGAQSDGFGHITGPLNMRAETTTYARQWWKDESELFYFIGCPSFEHRPALVLAVEAARCIAGTQTALAARLLRAAADELEATR